MHKERGGILPSGRGSGGTFSKQLNNGAKTKINLFHTAHAVETKPLCYTLFRAKFHVVSTLKPQDSAI